MPATLRLAIRHLAKTPGLTAIVVLTLALGIGATTAIYSVVNGVLLRPLAFRDPVRLFFLGEFIPGSEYGVWPASARHFTEWRGQSASFENLSAISAGAVNLTGKGEPERLEELRVSANLFAALGVQPAIGRGFLPDEDHSGKERVVVLGYQFWQRKYHADPEIIGSSIRLDNEAYTVVGVLPAWFHFPNAHALISYYPNMTQPDLFRPLVFYADELGQLMGSFNYGVIGRLRAGVDRQAAETELTGICARLSSQSGQKVDLRAVVTPLQEAIVGKARLGLLVLMGAVGAVLLIICVNLANLLLVRAEGAAVDSAIRLALGASRVQLLRQSLVETLLMAILGGALGVALAASGLRFLTQLAPPDIPRLDEVRLDGGVLAFAVALTSLTGLIFGLGPAWRTASSDPQGTLKSRGRTLAGEGRRLRNALVVVESGLSATLLILAGLLLASFSRLVHVSTGFTAPTVLAADISIPWTKYREPAQKNAFFEHVVSNLASYPGVASAAITSALPLKGETWIDSAWIPGDSRPLFERPSTNVRFVSPGYFRTMGIPLLAGRTFAPNDQERKVAVISERLARTLWPGASAIGRSFEGGFGIYEVIGIVGDVRTDAHKDAVPIFYHPYWDWPPLNSTVVARAVGDPRSIAEFMRQAVASVDPDVPVPSLRTMREVLDDSLSQRHFQAMLGTVFAATALLLAALGIYGVVSCSVARRTNEIGIRAALGAQPSDLRWMVIRQGVMPVNIGLLVGIAAALALGRVLGGLLFEIKPYDPATIAAVALIMLATAAAACLLPARRATQVDPVEALRGE
ncbi:MAG TPA: ABC transporter permease [Dongiaceae bacterium]|nr:ABC transporter permease [Dongiaceae bacterium]